MLKFIFLLCLLASSFVVYHWMNQTERKTSDTIIEAVPTFVAKDLTTKVFNSKGQLFEVLTAEHAEFYNAIDLTDLVQPTLTYIPAYDTEYMSQKVSNLNANESWKIRADVGVLDGTDHLSMRDNVVLTTSNLHAHIQSIESEYLEIDFGTEEIRTPKWIFMSGENFYNQGLGFLGNLKTKEFKIQEDCHAIFSGFTHQ